MDDLENELRGLKLAHLTESELAAYDRQELDRVRRARAEAHLKQCFICARELELLREEDAALSAHRVTAEDVAMVERLLESPARAPQPPAREPAGGAREVGWERLAEWLQQVVASWQVTFTRGAAARRSGPLEELCQWQSEDGQLRAGAAQEANGDLTIDLSSSEMTLEGTRLKVRLGRVSQEVTLERVSEYEVRAQVTVPRQQRPRNLADVSIENVQ